MKLFLLTLLVPPVLIITSNALMHLGNKIERYFVNRGWAEYMLGLDGKPMKHGVEPPPIYNFWWPVTEPWKAFTQKNTK